MARTPSTPFARFESAVLALYAPPIRREKTAAKLRQVLGEFAALCPTARDITPGAIAGWIAAHPERSAISSFSLLRSFASACRAGVSLGLLARDPFAFRRPSRWWPDGDLEPPERVRHLSAEQARLVIDRADREALAGTWEALRLATLIRLYLFTGCRKCEALGMRVADVDLPGRSIEIRPNARRALKTRASRRRLPSLSVDAKSPRNTRGLDCSDTTR